MSREPANSSSSTSNRSTSKSSNCKKSISKAFATIFNLFSFSSCCSISYGLLTTNKLLIMFSSKPSMTGFKGLDSGVLTVVA